MGRPAHAAAIRHGRTDAKAWAWITSAQRAHRAVRGVEPNACRAQPAGEREGNQLR